MKTISLALGALLATSLAFAEPAIRLNQQKPLSGGQSKSVSGTCGTAQVQIAGIAALQDGYFGIGNDPHVLLKTPAGKTLQLAQGVLSDYNGVACVSTKGGERLLIWSNCGGSACGESYNFYVVDPELPAVIAPKDIKKALCDEKCAAKTLGNRLPYKINGGR